MRVRRILRWLGWVVLVLIVCLVAAALLIQTPWGNERIRRLMIAQSARLLAGHLEVASLSGSVFNGVTLRGVTLVQDGQSFLQAEELTVRYKLRGFMHGAIDL